MRRRETVIRTEIDAAVYNEELLPWLPPKIIDCHVHIGLAEHCRPISPERLKANWALEVGVAQSWENLLNNRGTLFPRQEVLSLVFGGVFKETDIEANNDYILAGALKSENNAKALLVTRPEWSQSEIAEFISKGFVGVKPYPDLVPNDTQDISIYDFISKLHLKVVDELHGILMLHLPRAGRIADPYNIKELLEISESFPNIKIVVAHIGRAFCLPTAKEGLPHFVNSPRIHFDTSANLNSDVFQYALETIGPDRLLYGSDLPITLMRGVREHVGDKYINYTDAPYSWNVNRKTPEEEAKYTFFIYEEIRALIRAVEKSGLGAEAIEKIMYSNNAELLGKGGD
ncbi:MAG: amidohydrolase family protein [Armatimonadota bacterium]|nr:amidohydrolase family protein [Armatimonadota bacterium]